MISQDLLIHDPTALIKKQMDKKVQGSYSIMYHSKIKDTVIKYGYDWNDGWIAWACMCLMHSNKMRMMPRIHKLVIDPDKGFYALMEKLHENDAGWHDYYGGKIHVENGRPLSRTIKTQLVEVHEELMMLTGTISPVDWDLHDGNTMLRKRTKQDVVTDPWAYLSVSTSKLNDLIELTRIESDRIHVKGQIE